MKNRLFFNVVMILTVGLVFYSCEKDKDKSNPEFSLEQPDQIEKENYEIYSLVINEKYTSEKIVIKQATQTRVDLNYQNTFYISLKDKYSTFDTVLVKNHEELNQTAVLFGENFSSDTKQIHLISSEEFSYIFNGQDINGDWGEFYDKYEKSNGILQFSRIAFNSDKTQAIFEIGHTYASLGGDGSIIYLVKENDSWIVKEIIQTWIS